MKNTQDLDCSALQSIRHDKRRSWDHEFSRPWNTARSAYLWIRRQQNFNIVYDVEGDTASRGGIILLDVGAQCREVFDRFR